ncbi:MAG: L-serine ammonia-lyase, iron-sulfur-dependent, subunit alpha [Desulfuromonadales bacterium]
MKSIRELYRTGTGPSSSHTMAPRRAAEIFLQEQPDAAAYRVTLYGSLAATGRGHLTDQALFGVFGERTLELLWKPEEQLPQHPNGMCFEAFDLEMRLLKSWQIYSIGGGDLSGSVREENTQKVYQLSGMAEILQQCDRTGESLWEYLLSCEGADILVFLENVWQSMNHSIDRGLVREGALPGGLGLARRARSFHRKASMFGPHFLETGKLCSYALAVAEENASGGIIVTAPTCGASGVVPAVLRYLAESLGCDRLEILQSLGVAGLFGNLVKHNASISGAEVGCQGEIGTACAMAAAAAAKLHGGSPQQIEYAAEMGLEHNLGLTCDPVMGLVQIPCIERNAHAATRALNCCRFALLTDGRHKIPFDEIVAVMKETGQALPSLYRETSNAGIAKAYEKRQDL